MDTTIYVRDEAVLEQFCAEVSDAHAELLVFNYVCAQPYNIEMSFLVAPRYSEVVSRFFREFKLSLGLGLQNYMKLRVDEGVKMKNPFIYKPPQFGKPEFFRESYVAYMCAQKVVQKDFQFKPDIIIYPASDSFYCIDTLCDGNCSCINAIWNRPESQRLPIVKFTRYCRNRVNFPPAWANVEP